MLEIAIMIEGQNGLNWPRWRRIALAVEELGFAGLFRSDHFTNSSPPDLDSLELWVSLTWLASHTKRIKFGPLVSPISFRHPAFTARMAAAVDDLSNGRLVLGLGAGWQEREHYNYGFNLLDLPQRFARFEEGLKIIKSLLKSDVPVGFDGEYFQLRDAILLPRPQRLGGPPILVGGNGKKRTLPLVARYADEWNSLFISEEYFTELNTQLDKLLINNKRKPSDVYRSMMTGCIIAKDKNELKQKVAQRTKGKRTLSQLRERGLIVGTPGEISLQLNKYSDAGVQRIMLQWLDLDDINGLRLLAECVL
jgi:F420-dependent oxidoreductase-like protein